MDKVQRWLERIQRAPRREVANLDFFELLLETRIAQGETALPRARERGRRAGLAANDDREGK